MLRSQAFGYSKQTPIFILLATTLLSGLLLILINFYTIKILNATRAYVNGESHYSKSQKDATRYLISYLHTAEEHQWQKFAAEIQVPLSDGRAREGLVKDRPDEQIKRDLQLGRNHVDDLDDMLWLYRQFKDISYMKYPIEQWECADPLVLQLSELGQKIHRETLAGTLSSAHQEQYLSQISKIDSELTHFQQVFSEKLGASSRLLKGYLWMVNLFLIMAILISVGICYGIIVKKLTDSKLKIEQMNAELRSTNQELDHFVRSATHDLRSPIAQLKSIISLIRDESEPEKVNELLDLMLLSLDRQDQFISDIIDYSKNKRSQLRVEPLCLSAMIDDVLSQLHHGFGKNQIEIRKEIKIDRIFGDGLRLKMILNNLLSNAFKYADPHKSERFISITTDQQPHAYVIEVQDNGIGIKEEHHQAIFEMFFVTNSNTGSGLGLSIVQEAVQKMNGTISVVSAWGQGSKFILTIPKH